MTTESNPDRAAVLKANPHVESTVELAVALAEAKFPPKPKSKEAASRATQTESSDPAHAHARQAQYPNLRCGRPLAVTAARVELICGLIGKGETEVAACIRAGISNTSWCKAKRTDATLRERVAEVRDNWARLKHAQYAATRYESQIARAAGRKAIPPQPTRQAKWVCHYLSVNVPLNVVAIPQSEIEQACARCSLSLQNWQRQERAFNLMQRIYKKRSELRGQQPPIQLAPFHAMDMEQLENHPMDRWRA